jgi:hypothetical protein
MVMEKRFLARRSAATMAVKKAIRTTICALGVHKPSFAECAGE